MTNKLEITRELAERMVSCAEAYVDIDDADLIELRALLAAPAVERQEPAFSDATVMLAAHDLCPDGLSHEQRMEWVAKYFRQWSVNEQPAPAAPPSKFNIEDKVVKVTGDYRISGIVRSVFTMTNGAVRLVVEHKAEGGGSFLHVYGENNLEHQP